ncbi:MAG: hypothetical protein JSS86_18760 [Cyanobacteria bacterium SZAS LIN-2]|nr:hypothetical protein [Cyanobacteria bacterium SZAS LIN-3]MBS1998376.1 hypothetical protein [Cyanobacteria bacterium SZAS LIN-2]MBS2007948.1 hypothetical protein [Cyanobacteria bacterium SZAS TMP-1]
MRIAAFILVIVFLLALAGYFYWINSPFFAFQQVALSIKNHDAATFDRYVATEEIIDHLVDDILVEPALSTPNLSGFQKTVAGGALAIAKSNIAASLKQSLNKVLNKSDAQSPDNSSWLNFGIPAAIAATRGDEVTGSGIKDLLKTAGNEMTGELSRMKSTAYNRMIAYIQAHPDTVPGKLMNCPPQERASHARALLTDYGLAAENFKGLGDWKTSSDEILGREKADIGLRFFSPKISREITIMVALEKTLATKEWRIMRLSNIHDVMEQVEENYDRDIHELVEYSLSGMSNENLHSDFQNIKQKLQDHPAAQNFLKRLQLFR